MAYRDNIDRLARRITDRIPVKFKKLKEDDPEYKCLSEILNDEQCNLCLFFEVRKPMSFEEILKRTGWEEERVERVLKEVCDIGMIEYNWENEDHHKQYVMPQFVPGSAEFMVMNNDLVKEHPVVTDFFEQMTRLPLEKVTPMVPPGGAGIGMHVIPVEKSIEANQEAVSVEKISHWLNKYDKYALSPCSCRRQQRVRGEGTGDIEADVCIAVGDMADYVVETNKGGHYCTYEDVIETLERCERKGYVHQITNIDGEDKIFAICNCAAGVCNALRTSQLFNTPNMSASAYRAHVDVSKCVACGKCVEVCPVGAAKLGQKLCTKKGPIEYPQVELPDMIKWGPDHWNPDFRDTAKVNCHETGTAPCKTACPAHLPVQGYIKMAIIGAGPAGMSAAYYLRIKGYPVTIFEKEEKPGGMLRYGIPSFRLEKDVIDAEIEVLKVMGIELRCGVEIGKDITIDGLREEGYEAIYLAIGAQGGKKLNIPGMNEEYVMTGVDFLREVNKEESKDMLSGHVVVIGGGNVAMDVARSALRSGAVSVDLFCLESEKDMPASPDEVEEAIHEGITMHCGWGPQEIKDHTITLKKCISLGDETGTFNPSYDETQTESYPCDYVLLSVGQDIIPVEGLDINTNPNGTIQADAITLQTSVQDIFTGGDVYTGPRFAIDAIAQGKEAAESMHRFVHKGHSLTLGRDLHQFTQLDKDDILITLDFDHSKRQIPGTKQGLATETFKDLRSTFTPEQVQTEAKRCLGCGTSVVDPNKCIGCGLCTTKCEFDAIKLTRDIPEGSNMVRSEDKLKVILPYAAKRQIKILRNKKK